MADIYAYETSDTNRVIYRLTPVANGVNKRQWLDVPDAVPHDDVNIIFSGPVDSDSLFPTHPNPAPLGNEIEADWNFSTASNQWEMWGYIETDEGFLRDNNGNIGERGEVWISQCGGTPVKQPGYADSNTGDTGAGGTNSTILDATPISAGIHYIYVRVSDLSANGGIDLEFSSDGITGWANFPASRSFIDRPEVECMLIGSDEEIPVGWQEEPIKTCTPIILPNFQSDTVEPFIASGSVAANGTSTNASGATVVRNSAGLYTVSGAFGAGYKVLLTASEDVPNRDNRKIQWLNKTAASFQVSTTVDDNGLNSDGRADIPFDFLVVA